MSVDLSQLVVAIEVQGADKAPQQLATVADSADRVESSFGRLSAGTDFLVSRMAGLAVLAGISTQFALAARAAGDLDSALTRASLVTGATGPRLAAIREEMFRLSAGTEFAADAVAGAFSQIAADADGLAEMPGQLADITAAAITLAEATRSQLPDAADALSQVLRQFQAGSDDAGRFIDVLVDLGPTSDELADTVAALGAVGPVAAQAGLSLEETAGAISLLARAGIEGSEAGHGLRQVLLELESQADGRLRPSVVGLEAALRSADEAGLGFSARQAAIGSLLTQNADALVEAASGFGETGAATAAAAGTAAALDVQLARANAALQNARASAAEGLTPAMIGLVDASAGVLATFVALDQLGDPFDSVDEPQLGVLEGAIRGVGAASSLSLTFVSRLGLELEGLVRKAALVPAGPEAFLEGLREIDQQIETRRQELDRLTVDALDRAQGIQAPAVRPRVEGLDDADLPTPPALDFSLQVEVDTATGNALESEQARTEQILAEYQRRYASTEEQVRLGGEAEIAELERVQTFTVGQEELRTNLILAARERLEADLAGVRQQAYQTEVDASRNQAIALLEAQAEFAGTEAEADELRFAARMIRLQSHFSEVLGSEEAAADAIMRIRAQYEDTKAAQAKRAEDRQREQDQRANQERVRILTSSFASIAGAFASNEERVFRIQKLSALAEAALNIPRSASNAYAAFSKFGPYAAGAAAGVAVAAQVANMAAIAGADYGGGGGYSANYGGGVGGFAAPEAGGRLYEEESARDAPDLDTIRRSRPLPTFPEDRPTTVPQAVPQLISPLSVAAPTVENRIKVEVVQQGGSSGPVDVQESRGPDGEQLIRVFLQAAAQDVVQDGVLGQAMRQRYLMSGQLAVRG